MNRPGRKPERAGVEAFFEQRDHAAQLVRRRRARFHAHHHQAQRVVPDQHAGVDGGRRKGVEIVGKRRLAERQPWRARAEIIAQQFDLAGKARRDREAAMADDLGGDALAHLALGLGIDRQREVGMGLDVDEARRHREAGGVDDLGARRPAALSPIAAMRPSCDGEIRRDRRRCRCRRRASRRGSGCRQGIIVAGLEAAKSRGAVARDARQQVDLPCRYSSIASRGVFRPLVRLEPGVDAARRPLRRLGRERMTGRLPRRVAAGEIAHRDFGTARQLPAPPVPPARRPPTSAPACRGAGSSPSAARAARGSRTMRRECGP